MISVRDITGRLYEEAKMTVAPGVSSSYMINADHRLAPGIYFAVISVNNAAVTRKIVISN